MTHMLGLESGVGQLRRALVHRAAPARGERDGFAQAKVFVLDRVCTRQRESIQSHAVLVVLLGHRVSA